MTETLLYVIVGLAVISVLLLTVLLMRKQSNEPSTEIMTRLSNIEHTGQTVLVETSKSAGGLESIAQQLRGFTQTTATALDSSRQAVDDKLSQTLLEARSGRAELTSAFHAFEGKLEQRLSAFDTSLTARFEALQQSISARLEESSKALAANLAQAQADAAINRKELTETLTLFKGELTTTMGALTAESSKAREALAESATAFETRIQERFEALSNANRQTLESLKVDITTQLGAMQQTLTVRLEDSNKALMANLAQAQTDTAGTRKELTETLVTFKAELNTAMGALTGESLKARETLAESATAFETRIQERFEALTASTRVTLDSLKTDVVSQLGVMSTAMKDQLDGNGNQLKNQFTSLQESVGQQLQSMAVANSQTGDQLRVTLNERLISIQTDNTNKLEEMRKTVDEKLHATLEQRLGDSFKLVSERLEQVHTGLGEMKTLAGSVGDLKRVMTNVRARGTWGEVQLGAIIENVMTSGQYARNVKTIPGSNDMVEFAIKFPGNSDEVPLWLPIDSKYPVEQYQRLLDAYDAADKALILSCGNAFETSLRAEAKKIATKYVSPPHTTDFAILFVPTEGLFAEVMRRPGLADALQTEFHVLISGPANLAAMLSSFQMGFRTLAIEKRSSEVWGILSSVKTEFQKFGDIVDATKKSIDAAANKFTELGRRSRAIKKHLQDVEELPTGSPSTALGHNFVALDLDDDSELEGTSHLAPT
jgi:DNA recombination protein RmuC